jgi:hypothetical protein
MKEGNSVHPTFTPFLDNINMIYFPSQKKEIKASEQEKVEVKK